MDELNNNFKTESGAKMQHNFKKSDIVEEEDQNDINVNNLNKAYTTKKVYVNQNSENLELTEINNQETKTKRNVTVTANKSNLLHTIDKLLDFNLKFSSSELEQAYNKAYLAVTRLLFLKYLFFLIIFSLLWIIYFSVKINNSSEIKLDGKVESYIFINKDLKSENSTKSITVLTDFNPKHFDPNKTVYLINNIIYDKKNSELNKVSNVVVLTYLSVIEIIFTIVFALVLMIEINETRYRNLEKEIQKNELEKKVDTKKAERDLKLAMEDIVKKEEDNIDFKKKLKSKYRNVAKQRNLYSKLAYTISMVIVSLMFILCFLVFFDSPFSLTFISHFIWFCTAILLLYLIYPFQMMITIVFGVSFSIIFELLSVNKQLNLTKSSVSIVDRKTYSSSTDQVNFVYLNSQLIIFIFIKILLHSSLHLIASYLKLSLQGIKRETFLKVAHIHKAHLSDQQDKDITERMIKSIMPPLFTHVFGKPEEFKKSVNCVHQMRPLFIYPVNEISILFADIVGFTRMSSTKTAEELVFLLNDLYGRFDKLCEQAGCEKISTLGDCYYCVSGCLNSRKDHAKCCVEMGLLMVKEIELFNKVHNVDVNMRVGVHTGNALCGFIGGKRFRFDVWSGDVTLANKMESSGKAGWVHISEDTFRHLDGKYNTEIGEKYSGKSTYFVIRESKRETVADALKQFASYDAESFSSKNNEVQNENNEQDTAPDKNNYKSYNNINENDSNKKNDKFVTCSNELDEIELLNKNSQSTDIDHKSENWLLLAVKNIQFFKPEFNFFTMRFEKIEEDKYRSYLVDSNNKKTSHYSSKFNNFWTSSRNSLFLSILISFIINLFVSTCYFLSFIVSSMSSIEYKLSSSYKSNFILILVLYCIIILLQSLFLVLCLMKCSQSANTKKSVDNQDDKNKELNENMLRQNGNGVDDTSSFGYSIGFKTSNNRRNKREKFIKFILINFTSIILLSLVPLYILITSMPVISNILLNTWSSLFYFDNSWIDFVWDEVNLIDDFINDKSVKRINLFSVYSFMTYVIALIHFGSFIQLSSLFKTLVCFLFALSYSLIGLIGISDKNLIASNSLTKQIKNVYSFSNSTNEYIFKNDNISTDSIFNELNKNGYSLEKIFTKSFNFYSYLFLNDYYKENIFIVIDTFLIIFLIWIVNSQSELIQRLSFKYDQDANLKVTYAREQKELANWLIDVVLPIHVVDHVKEKKQYSRNYNCVGVLFVSLCNFWEFFEESYEGGRELLRVLNEITVDFDRLFDDPKYKNVEKIKSIGSTIMIASGLNPDESLNENNNIKHLYDLVDFALELNEKLEAFNNEAMSVCHFKFQMRMGFNCGPVTAGVIGTERLLYDIWGDTVNVASRMDSTGQPGFLQTPKEVVSMLNDSYKFFERGQVQIKGKDQMTTYFMNPKENKKQTYN